MSVKQDYPALPDQIMQVYTLTCCSCGKEMGVNPSIMMTGMGMNIGSGSCLYCGAFMHLWVEGDVMKSEPWSGYAIKLNQESQDGTHGR